MKKILFLIPLLVICSLSISFSEVENVPLYFRINSDTVSTDQKTRIIFNFETRHLHLQKGDSVRISYNNNERTLHTNKNGASSLLLKPGKYKFQFFYSKNHYEVTSDSILIEKGHTYHAAVFFESSTEPRPMKKPVIYVYPDKTMQVNISLDVKGKLGFTYPAYKNGWSFQADPDGTIRMNGKNYEYLFWEGEAIMKKENPESKNGFVIHRDSLISFFENQLSLMGLSAREQEDFITYWVPLMQKNEWNYIHFLFTGEMQSYATLTIDPQPTHFFRVFMQWEKANSNLHVMPQPIEHFERTGFTVVEWGGGENALAETNQ
jgi:hypothetical protein